MELQIVDVFAESRYAGNQLAVVRQAGNMDAAQMQDIAREMNFSETTFVTREGDRRATVRIFTPESELPFAGHPTIGTAWVLANGAGDYVLDLPAGAVPVRFVDGVGWMTPPPVRLKQQFAADQVAALIGLTVADLAVEYPAQLAEIGPTFALIGVRDVQALRRARLNENLQRRLVAQGAGSHGVFVFARDAYDDGSDFGARMFFDLAGVREDPATGSANTAFAAYLKAQGETRSQLVVAQGMEIKRPSRLYLNLGEPISVGGRVQGVALGRLVD